MLSLNQVLPKLVEESLNELSDEIVQFNKEQLREGKRSDDTLLPYYSNRTINIKQSKGRIIMGRRIALIDTGDFWGSMWAKAENGNLTIFADDYKTIMLAERYGDKIFGLDPENHDLLKFRLFEILKPKINSYLNGM